MTGFTTAIMPTSFKAEVLQGLHNFTASTGNDFRIALGIGSPTGTYDATFQKYTAGTGSPTATNMGTDELPTATGYTQGGFDFTAANNQTPTTSGTTAYTQPSLNPSWTSATFTTSGCVIYNNTNGTQQKTAGSRQYHIRNALFRA